MLMIGRKPSGKDNDAMTYVFAANLLEIKAAAEVIGYYMARIPNIPSFQQFRHRLGTVHRGLCRVLDAPDGPKLLTPEDLAEIERPRKNDPEIKDRETIQLRIGK